MTPPAPGPDDLRLVLFGLSGSGKSSLLGALGRAAAVQGHLLGGKIDDPGNALAALAHPPGAAAAGRSAGEITTYPIHFIPNSAGPTPGGRIDAVLVDCDGRAAGDLLVQQEALADDSPEGTLAHEVGDADGLILVLDAATPADQLEGQFAEFARFLESVQRSRGARAEVGGLPVFLDLHKCDRLARPGDGPAGWMERVEQRKRELAERFRAFLADREGAPPGPAAPPPVGGDTEDALAEPTLEPMFGRIELHVWATATRWPELAGAGERSQEPYGVAELFRQAIAEGVDYQRRCRQAQRWLWVVSAGALGLVGLLVAVIVGLFALHQSTQLTLLESRIREFQFLQQLGPRPGLAGSLEQLRIRKSRLDDIRANPSYERLEPELREQVDTTYAELNDYIATLERLLERRPPTSEQSEAALDRSLEELRGERSALPERWKDTPIGGLLRQRVQSGQALHAAVQTARNWYLDAADQAERLQHFSAYELAPDGSGVDWPEWTAQSEKLLSPSTQPPFRPNDPIPDMQGATLTFAAALRFDTVEAARRRWLDARRAVRGLLAVTAAVGLAAPREFKAPPVLAFGPAFRLPAARQRLADLKRTYPDYDKRFAHDEVPLRIRPAVRRAAQEQYQHLLRVGQAEVLAQYRQAGKGEETPARWDAVRAWLKAPEELASWRVLALTLLRLTSPSAEDPVNELAAFLGARQFPIDLDAITLEVPQRSDLRPRADARLTVTHPAGMRQPALTFESSGQPARDPLRRVVSFTFRRAGPGRLVYRPGDALWAELPLTGGKERLVWSSSRSDLYQLERLRNAPRRQGAGAKTLSEGRLVEDARLLFKPEDGLPAVPDLLPRVNLDQ